MGWRVTTPGQQMLAMADRFPDFKARWRRAQNAVEWRGSIRPTPLSTDYEVRIEYRLGKNPRVWIVSPELQRCNGAAIPHVYEEGHLCLFLPETGEWAPNKLIADTIVPWTATWLYFYEVWHATGGEWLGGGEHPARIKSRRRPSKQRKLRKHARSHRPQPEESGTP